MRLEPGPHADEGPAAGPASLVGLKIARDNGWTAGGTYDRNDKGDTGDKGETT